MEATKHGGDTVSFQEEYGAAPLDFSANTNPLGMPRSAVEAARQALETADRYPDSQCRGLRDAIASSEGVEREHILCGNGAADLIYRAVLALRPQRAILPAPTFSEYRQALSLVECGVEEYQLSAARGFAVCQDILDALVPPADLLFLCEPNNPTGLTTDPGLLRRILERCRETGVTLVVDECFNGFLPSSQARSCKRYLGQYPNLVILRAFTKLYGMAGLRLGYLLCADKELPERIATCGPPWPVSSPAQAAGIAALGDQAYVRRTRRLVQEQREHMKACMQANGYRVYPGQANYLFFYSQNHCLHTELAAQGILIRDCAGFAGLEKGYYRVAVRTPEENEVLLQALRGKAGNG